MEQLQRKVAEAREQQAATAEILRVISSSPTDLQRVFQVVATSAARVCDADDATIFQVDGDLLRRVAHHGPIPSTPYAIPLMRGILTAHAVLDRQTIQVTDLQAEADAFPESSALARRDGQRTLLAVPLICSGQAIGAIAIRRTEVRPFSNRQVDLLKTFADQAVIAIENTRLFEAEQASKRELTESLEQQTATANVLKVISRSALDLQRVLDALVESAARLCNAHDAAIFQVRGDGLRLVAHHGQIPFAGPVGQFTTPLVRGLITGRVVVDRQTIHVADVLVEGDEYPDARKHALQLGWRTALGVPLVHSGAAIGMLFIRRTEVRPFTDRQIELVNTFADQAVIAIENTRLFEAEQASKRELQQSLDYQTATSEVLDVISRSPTDVQPVFETIARNAARLCSALFCFVYRFDGKLIHFAASDGLEPEAEKDTRSKYPLRPCRASAATRAILNAAVEEIPDVDTDPDYEHKAGAKLANYRSIVAVPMLKDGSPIGAIAVSRPAIGRFPRRQIDLLKTFADQAVIAIENTRLFEAEQASKRELQESLEYQTAISEVLAVISRSPSELQPVLNAIVATARGLCEAERAVVWQIDDDEFRPIAFSGMDASGIEKIAHHRLPIGSGSVLGRAADECRAVQVLDAALDNTLSPAQNELARAGNIHSILAVPLVRDGRPTGCISVSRTIVQSFSNRQVTLLETFADQAVIAIENTRLFEEVQARTRELAKTVEDLEVASQHKNQFVANMSHELRTPLAAILGYAELIQEGFYGAVPEKSLDALTRIGSNGKHLLGLINTVLDIAKIESGQFTLNMTEYAIESVVETVRAATESLAQNKKLTLTTSVDKPLPIGLGDEQRLTQVLLNLVGNAIKFTDAGEVSIAAGTRNGRFAVSVTDTGPGIPLDQQGRIFEEFHQVDSSLTKAKGGTGLGLAIAKQIVEMHGGRIWVVSTPGKGSTFQMELPIRAEFRKRGGAE